MNGIFDIAVADATTPAGEALLARLAEIGLPVRRVVALTEGEGDHVTVPFGDRQLPLQAIDEFDFTGVGLALLIGSPELTAHHAERALDAGALVVDGSGLWAADGAIPLLWAGAEREQFDEAVDGRCAALPSASALLAVGALAPIQRHTAITQLHLTLLRPASAAGRSGIETLAGETARLLNAQPLDGGGPFPQQLAFNLIPAVGAIADDGSCAEERTLSGALKRLLLLPITANDITALQVPLFFGDALVVQLTCEQSIEPATAVQLLRAAGVEVLEGDAYPTPVGEVGESSALWVGRLRADPESGRLTYWVVADAIRAGMAEHGVQIAEILVKEYLIAK